MWLLWIPIILIGAVSIVGTVFYFKKRQFFLEHKSFVEFWGIALSILFALFAFLQTQSAMKSSTEDFGEIVSKMNSIITKAEESSKSLHNVDSSLSKLPIQMDSLSRSIESFNNVIASQREQLTSTLNGLNNSIIAFRTTVDSMIERFNRKPNLDIDLLDYLTDTSRVITKIVITNLGYLLADVYRMRFAIDSNFVYSFECAKWESNTESFSNYQIDFNTPAPVFEAEKPTKFDCKINLKNEDNIILRIIVFFRASFGNDGTETMLFLFKKDQITPIKINPDVWQPPINK